jgi:hypothetical protein
MLHTTAFLAAVFTSSVLAASRCPPAITLDQKPQIFVASDISNEPDDTMSIVRMLLHSDQYNITGIAAVTSVWLNSSTYPDQILNTVRAYGRVVDNLNTHSDGTFPTEEYLASIVKSGQPVYGTAAIGKTPLSSGAKHLIDVVDGMPDESMLHFQAWGGVNLLAETLAYIQQYRAVIEVARFINKLRIYTISDQDNAGPWIRLNFPSIPYVVSLHGWNQYGHATWSGISGEQWYYFDYGGPNSSLVDNAYVHKNFQIGPLGSLYPDIVYIMEGDSPSLMHTFVNGLGGGPYDHPEWGGWGGRYTLNDITRQSMVYSDARDNVTGADGRWYTSNQATIWRWRQAYQDEMSARVQWSVNSAYGSGSHPPVVVLNDVCGSAPLEIDVKPNEVVTLDASGSYDPDSNRTASSSPLTYNWFQYKEPTAQPSGTDADVRRVPTLNFTLSDNGKMASVEIPSRDEACSVPQPQQSLQQGVNLICQIYHVILEVKGSGDPPIRRYRRAMLNVKVDGSSSESMKRDEL